MVSIHRPEGPKARKSRSSALTRSFVVNISVSIQIREKCYCENNLQEKHREKPLREYSKQKLKYILGKNNIQQLIHTFTQHRNVKKQPLSVRSTSSIQFQASSFDSHHRKIKYLSSNWSLRLNSTRISYNNRTSINWSCIKILALIMHARLILIQN